MTTEEFRRLALALPDAEEHAHMGHPDFRVDGKIFATLGYPNETWGMVKLFPDQQRDYMAEYPQMFEPVAGTWGKQGCTKVMLGAADPAVVEKALRAAWRKTAVRTSLEELEEKPTAAPRKRTKSRAVLPARESS